jgi:hypothetical protein
MFEAEKREFKRKELEHELAHEDAWENAFWEVLVNGNPINIEGRGLTRMQNIGYKISQKPWNKGKNVTLKRL